MMRRTTAAQVFRASVAACLLGLAPALPAAEWAPPAGIPAPPFGILESHAMYAGEPGYRDAGNGPYTIYVDNKADCDDTGPATAEQPRCSIPADIGTPGAVVEVHGGPYRFDGADVTIDANGTAERPVFLRGVDDGRGLPVIYDADTVTLQGTRFIVEDLVFDRSGVRTEGKVPSAYGRSHIAVRNVEIKHHPRKNGSVLTGSHIVFYRNHVHHNQSDDRHGTTVGPGAQHVWIVDNHFHHNGGDAVQLCHGCRKEPPRFIYIGRNLMHGDRENGVDLKYGENIVVSENVIHGYTGAPEGIRWCFDDGSGCRTYSSGSDGSAVVIGSDGAPINSWIIFNRIYGSNHGIRIEEAESAWIVGNVIHDVRNRAIALEKEAEPLYIVNNTIYGARHGIDQYWRKNFELHIHNNIFAGIREGVFRADDEVASRSVVEHNLFWRNGDEMMFRWGRFQGPTSDSSDLGSMFGDGNIVGDPGFADAANADFRLESSSAAIDAAGDSLAALDEEFRERFGGDVSIAADAGGQARPVDGDGDGEAVSDIGSYEYVPSPAPAAARHDSRDDDRGNDRDDPRGGPQGR
jgi:hypothetical protein